MLTATVPPLGLLLITQPIPTVSTRPMATLMLLVPPVAVVPTVQEFVIYFLLHGLDMEELLVHHTQSGIIDNRVLGGGGLPPILMPALVLGLPDTPAQVPVQALATNSLVVPPTTPQMVPVVVVVVELAHFT